MHSNEDDLGTVLFRRCLHVATLCRLSIYRMDYDKNGFPCLISTGQLYCHDALCSDIQKQLPVCCSNKLSLLETPNKAAHIVKLIVCGVKL